MNLRAALTPLSSTNITERISSGGFFGGMFGGFSTKNGTPVNTKSALTLSAFYNGIEIIGNDYAKLPKAVFQKKDKNINKLGAHPVSRILKQPNRLMTAFSFDKLMVQEAILKGNAYAKINRHAVSGVLTSLEHIDQETTPVEVVKSNGDLFYKISGKTYNSSDVFHIPGFSFNGMTGIGIVCFAAKNLGVSLESQEFAMEYYATKGVGTAVVSTSKDMDAPAKIRYGEAVSKGLSTSSPWKVAVLDEVSSFNHLKITPQEALFLETNKQGIEEVARWLNLSTIKLKSLAAANNSISQEQKIQHVEDSILPWVIKFEQEYFRKMFSQTEQETMYVKCNLSALMRADLKTQSDAYYKAIFGGWKTPNEIRELNEDNPIAGFDELFVASNLQTLEQIQKGLKDE